MKIYTKTGDDGKTSLFGGARVSKSSARVSTYGDVDELNSVIGWCRIVPLGEPFDSVLARMQSCLFDVGAELSNASGKDLGIALVGEEEIAELERTIDAAELELTPLRTFVLPGGSEGAARFHVARTVARRTERSIVALAAEEELRPEIVHYVNRLSDLCFVLARLANVRADIGDVPWVGRGKNAKAT